MGEERTNGLGGEGVGGVGRGRMGVRREPSCGFAEGWQRRKGERESRSPLCVPVSPIPQPWWPAAGRPAAAICIIYYFFF